MSREVGGRHVYINGQTGKNTSAYEKRNELAHDHLGSAAYVGAEVLTICPLCFGVMSHNGSSIDHIVSIEQLISDLGMEEDVAKQKVGHESNLITAHTGCNSSKKQKDLFAWWKSEDSKSYLTPDNRERVIALLDKIHANHVKTSITHFAFGEYKSTILQIKSLVVTH
jgi:5-methylcytosine-specific restriction endonuclease McrA